MALRAQLDGLVPDAVLRHISHRFDVIGDIAVISIPDDVAEYAPLIADAIRSRRRTIRTVIRKSGAVGSESRIARYEIVSGNSTVTTHREYGFSYRLDLATVFYNPHLACERNRVTGQVQAGESVYVPFCGIGPFVIPAAAKGASVTAVEKNPEAFGYLQENLRANSCADRVTSVCGDVFGFPFLAGQVFDRIIIPTPYGQDAILPLLKPRVKPDGMLHFYTFKNRKQSEEMEAGFEKSGYNVLCRRKCGNVAPSVSRWVFDLKKADTS